MSELDVIEAAAQRAIDANDFGDFDWRVLEVSSRRVTVDVVSDGWRVARCESEETAAYIASVPPTVVIDLVRRLRRAERAELEWRDAAITAAGAKP